MENPANNLTEDKKAELIDKYGLSAEPDPSKNPLFQGDFGFSVNFPVLIAASILLLAAGILVYVLIRKRKA
ncbi:hypothetical protein NST84_14020 [Paenibacillus sp. FSL R7-0345]|uniref:hypothetical protein n=1 Tax=Paenibacillus sp. FSL R7-0345 TaxID=2954535 RepID=UPI00315AEFE7